VQNLIQTKRKNMNIMKKKLKN